MHWKQLASLPISNQTVEVVSEGLHRGRLVKITLERHQIYVHCIDVRRRRGPEEWIPDRDSSIVKWQIDRQSDQAVEEEGGIIRIALREHRKAKSWYMLIFPPGYFHQTAQALNPDK